MDGKSCVSVAIGLIAEHYEVIAKPPKTSHAKFAKYAKFCFMDDFANLADFA